ncbi:putative bifunctional purine biosynthetic protein [Apiospora kogelbergensis]|uniref:putative bifunctional purine biosynthetic protein n=1 Tax=Apiospora kogelbergensis TaxID=1337665 RepID=UPI0031312671
MAASSSPETPELTVLIIGKGGREYALAWKLAQSPLVSRIFVLPGNGGTEEVAKTENVAHAKANDYQAIVAFAKENGVGLVVSGPDDAVVDGIEDYFRGSGIPCFASSRAAAEIEGSKAYSKGFMKRHGIPTAEGESFEYYSEARKFIKDSAWGRFVIKASGLAAGKGVILAANKEKALEALDDIMVYKRFGKEAGEHMVVEELLDGDEISIHTFCDAHTHKTLASGQDHKRAWRPDGPNTGGMGIYTPVNFVSEEVMEGDRFVARAVCIPLMCGNTILLKPSEFSPKSQHLVVRALREAGLPAGCLNYLPVSPAQTPAASCLKPCVLELGGKVPLVILDDAVLDDAVEAVAFGALANAGQIYMSTERVIVHADVAPVFKERLLRRFQTVKVDDHTQDDAVPISGMFSPVHAQRVKDMLEAARSAGAQVLMGDLSLTGPRDTIMGPHIVDGVTLDIEIFRRESFGPLVCLTEFRGGDDEAVQLANASEYSLSGAVLSRDVMRALAVARRMRTGACHVNGATIFFEPTVPNGRTGVVLGMAALGGRPGSRSLRSARLSR